MLLLWKIELNRFPNEAIKCLFVKNRRMQQYSIKDRFYGRFFIKLDIETNGHHQSKIFAKSLFERSFWRIRIGILVWKTDVTIYWTLDILEGYTTNIWHKAACWTFVLIWKKIFKGFKICRQVFRLSHIHNLSPSMVNQKSCIANTSQDIAMTV